METAIIIPAYNEEKTLKNVILGVRKYHPHNIIIVCSPKSKDRTFQIAKEFADNVLIDPGKGKGAALKFAIKAIKAENLVFFDADGSHEPADIPKLIEPLVKNRADMVVASRLRGGSDEFHGSFINFSKVTITHFIQLLINYRWGVDLTDSENGFRAIKRNIAKRLRLKANDFDIEQEMVLKCLKKGFRIVEIPSHEYTRQGGKPKLNVWKSGWKFIWRLKDLI